MGFKCGIVGLPNVGKSTIFNALTQTAQAEVANYPFCTIEPNIGKVVVPDSRLRTLAKIASSKKVIPTCLTFLDIAGLVRGASKGEGLGNKFLSHIREVDAVAYVLRCFVDNSITHVENRIDPLADADVIETELMLADLKNLEKCIAQIEKKVKTGDNEAKTQYTVMKKPLFLLREGRPARFAKITPEEMPAFRALQLLTSKPVVYVCNVKEASTANVDGYSKQVEERAKTEGAAIVIISAKIESELAGLASEDRNAFLAEIGLSQPGLNRLIMAGYSLLDLVTYFTVGPKEARAWTITRGTKAPQAAGVIHTDFERGFIRAETIAFDDYVAENGETDAKRAGKMRLEGKEYTVQDGDVMRFRFAD